MVPLIGFPLLSVILRCGNFLLSHFLTKADSLPLNSSCTTPVQIAQPTQADWNFPPRARTTMKYPWVTGGENVEASDWSAHSSFSFGCDWWRKWQFASLHPSEAKPSRYWRTFDTLLKFLHCKMNIALLYFARTKFIVKNTLSGRF